MEGIERLAFEMGDSSHVDEKGEVHFRIGNKTPTWSPMKMTDVPNSACDGPETVEARLSINQLCRG